MDEFLISAKHDDVWMPERTSGGIVDFPHAGGELLKPFEDRLTGYRIGDWQGKFFTHDLPHRYGKSTATILVIRFCQCSNVASLTLIQSHTECPVSTRNYGDGWPGARLLTPAVLAPI